MIGPVLTAVALLLIAGAVHVASILMLPLLLLTLPWLAYASRALYRSALPV